MFFVCVSIPSLYMHVRAREQINAKIIFATAPVIMTKKQRRFLYVI